MAVCQVFASFADWAARNDVRNINALPGLWERDFGEFRVRMNGLGREIDRIPPYHMAVEWRGLPAAIIGVGGGIAAPGLEDGLIAAMEAAA